MILSSPDGTVIFCVVSMVYTITGLKAGGIKRVEFLLSLRRLWRVFTTAAGSWVVGVVADHLEIGEASWTFSELSPLYPRNGEQWNNEDLFDCVRRKGGGIDEGE